MNRIVSIDLTLQIVNIEKLTDSLKGVIESWGVYANGRYVARIRRSKSDESWEVWFSRAEKPACRKRDPSSAMLYIIKQVLEESIGTKETASIDEKPKKTRRKRHK